MSMVDNEAQRNGRCTLLTVKSRQNISKGVSTIFTHEFSAGFSLHPLHLTREEALKGEGRTNPFAWHPCGHERSLGVTLLSVDFMAVGR